MTLAGAKTTSRNPASIRTPVRAETGEPFLRGGDLFLPPASLCTDNAAMAGVAFAKLAAGQVSDLDIDVTPGLVRPGR